MNYKATAAVLLRKGKAWARPEASTNPRVKNGERILFLQQDKYEVGELAFCKVDKRYQLGTIIKVDSKKGYYVAADVEKQSGWTKVIFGRAFRPM